MAAAVAVAIEVTAIMLGKRHSRITKAPRCDDTPASAGRAHPRPT